MNYDLNMNVNTDMVKFDKMPPQAFMIGLLSAFDNRFQTCADKFFKEIMNILVRRSRLSGVARATCPNRREPPF